MSKISKLIRTPVLFFKDAYANKVLAKPLEKRVKTTSVTSNQKPKENRKQSGPAFNDFTTETTTEHLYLYSPFDDHISSYLESNTFGSNNSRIKVFFPTTISHFAQVERSINDRWSEIRPWVIRNLIEVHEQIKAVIFSTTDDRWNKLLYDICLEMGIAKIYAPLILHSKKSEYTTLQFEGTLNLTSRHKVDLIDRFGNSISSKEIKTQIPNVRPADQTRRLCSIFGVPNVEKFVCLAIPANANELLKNEYESLIDYLVEQAQELNFALIIDAKDIQEIINKKSLEKIFGNKFAVVNTGKNRLISQQKLLNIADCVISNDHATLTTSRVNRNFRISLEFLTDFTPIAENPFHTINNKLELKRILALLTQNLTPKEVNKDYEILLTNPELELQEILDNSQLNPSSASSKAKQFVEDSTTEQIVIGSHFPKDAWSTTNAYTPQMLGAKEIVNSISNAVEINELLSVSYFLQWGIRESEADKKQRAIARRIGKPVLIAEDGFIRSVDIGLSKEPGLSIILDTNTSYYDANGISDIERLLQYGDAVSTEDQAYSRKIINKIVCNKISKYNHAPNIPLTIGKPDRRKILLIDQRFGDQSVSSGLASEQTFSRMLTDAIKDNPDSDIILKRHPDAIKGGKSSYFSDERVAFIKYLDNIHLIDFDINPHCLFEIVEEVYVATSGMGFEALMAGKVVRCYGAPFYSGWGCTKDMVKLERRTRKRTLEEIFHYSYIVSSRYFNPTDGKKSSIDETINYILKKRGW